MRTLLTLALVACAAAPAAAQTYYRVQGSPYYQPSYRPAYPGRVIVQAPGTYVQVQPRVSYSYNPVTYGQPTYTTVTYPQTQSFTPPVVYSMPAYTTPVYTTSVRSYMVPQTALTYSTPTYYTTPTYSTPSYYTTPSYSFSTPLYSTPSYYTPPLTPTYGTNQFAFTPTFNSVPMTYQPRNVFVTNPLPQQPTLNYFPSTDYNRRLLTPVMPRGGYAERPIGTYYR